MLKLSPKVADGEPAQFNWRPQEKLRSLLRLPRTLPGGSVHGKPVLRAHMGEMHAEIGTGPGTHAFISVRWVECSGVLGLRLDWLFKPKRMGFWWAPPGLIWGVNKWKAVGVGGDCAPQGLLGSHIRNLHFCVMLVTLWAVI